MDIYLNNEKTSYVKNVLSTSLTHEETMEMIVPDALPDISRIVDSDAVVLLRSKSTDNGRVSVTGIIAVTIIYLPESDDSVQKMNLEIPFTIVANDADITSNSKVTACVSVASADTSVINPRKIIARVDLISEINCYNDDEVSISSGMDDDNDAAIETLTNHCDVYTTTSVKEKTFVISDELSIPQSLSPVDDILKYTIMISPEDTKVVGSKLILRGSTFVTLLYNPMGGGDISKADFSTEFSQIIELDSPAGESIFDIILMLTNAYFDNEQSPHNPDGRTIMMEIHAVAQCVASEYKTINYIADLYSTKFKLEQTIQDNVFESKNNLKAGAVFHGVLETPSNVSKVIALNVHTGAVMQQSESNAVMLKCPLIINALYLSDDNRIMSVMRQYEVEANADVTGNARNLISAKCGKDVYSAAAGSGIEIRVPVDFNISENVQKEIKSLSGLTYDTTAPLDLSKEPSLVVYRAAKGDSLWKLAKKHYSTAKLILTANSLEREENINAGQLVIIPKKR